VTHPFTSTNITVSRLQKPLEVVATLSFVLLAVSIGLAFTALSVISKVAVPVTGSVALLSFTGVIALPFLPWVLGGVAVLAVGLIVYEFIRYKSLKAVVVNVESLFGSSTAGSTAPILPQWSTALTSVPSLVEQTAQLLAAKTPAPVQLVHA